MSINAVSERGLGSFELREATAADLPAISEVLIAAGVEAWGDWLGAGRVAGQTPKAAEWLQAGGLVVACTPDGVVGFVRTEAGEGGEGWVELLYTHPRVWGEGAGRMLLAAGLEALRDAGCTTALLWTEERNARPRRVYEAAGWRADGEVRERSWRGARLRELRYRREL